MVFIMWLFLLIALVSHCTHTQASYYVDYPVDTRRPHLPARERQETVRRAETKNGAALT